MKIRELYWQYRAKASLLKTLLRLKIGLNASWGKGIIEGGAIIDGPLHRLILNENSTIEKGAIINTRYDGKIEIGKNTNILYGAMLLTYYGNITIGDYCSVNPYVILYGQGNLKIGNFVRIATHTVVIPSNHTFQDVSIPIHNQPLSNQGIIIHDDVWIGCGVKILDGVTIGTGSVIAAGAVVNRNVEAFTVNAGVPSKIIKRRL